MRFIRLPKPLSPAICTGSYALLERNHLVSSQGETPVAFFLFSAIVGMVRGHRCQEHSILRHCRLGLNFLLLSKKVTVFAPLMPRPMYPCPKSVPARGGRFFFENGRNVSSNKPGSTARRGWWTLFPAVAELLPARGGACTTSRVCALCHAVGTSSLG